jgi:hypothetical protein
MFTFGIGCDTGHSNADKKTQNKFKFVTLYEARRLDNDLRAALFIDLTESVVPPDDRKRNNFQALVCLKEPDA